MESLAASDNDEKPQQINTVANKKERWNNAIERDLGDGVTLQMVGLESPTGTVFARLRLCQADNTFCSSDVVRQMVQAIIQESEEPQQETTDKLFRLGAVWSSDTHNTDDESSSSMQKREKIKATRQ